MKLTALNCTIVYTSLHLEIELISYINVIYYFCSRTSSIVASYTIQKQIKIIKKIFSMNLKFHNYEFESDFNQIL